MNEIELIRRIAATLKHEVGPATQEPLAKSQAFMASVVLDKVARQLATQTKDLSAHTAELYALAAALEQEAVTTLPAALRDALEAFRAKPEKSQLGSLVEALYDNQSTIDSQTFEQLLSRIRRTLRADIDRRMTVAG